MTNDIWVISKLVYRYSGNQATSFKLSFSFQPYMKYRSLDGCTGEFVSV